MLVARKRKGRDELRQKVIETAYRAFSKSGIKNVRMDDIALSLSISKRTLYELFQGKEQLLLDVARFRHDNVTRYMKKIISKTENALEVIFSFYLRESDEFCGMSPIFLKELVKYPKVLEYIHAERRKNETISLDYFRRGVEQGLFRDDVNYEVINKILSTQMDVWLYTDQLDVYSLPEILQETAFLFLRGISTEKGLIIVDEFMRKLKEKPGNRIR